MKKLLLLTLTIMVLAATANAQPNNEPTNRKKVGVVLSGGGAKGMAHVGVLKVLERAGIPVDVVTGTSMGSIVGGLYAIGYNANSLDSIVREQEWSYVISDRENLRNQSLDDRKKQNTYAISTGFSLGNKDVTAGGLIKGKNLAELFQKLCTGYTDSLDFNRDLPIPFACVATNIIDNTEVVFHSGRLPQAMRASMSIPGAFAPVRLGDMVLVDGGLRNNFPVDIAREMGADIVIGVTLQEDAKTADEIGGSTMSVLNQIIDVNCKNKFDDNVADTDLHFRINTQGYNAASFTTAAIDTLIRRGEEEAMRHWDEIMALKKVIGIDDSFRPAILHPLRPKAMTEENRVTGYVFENMTAQDERFLRQKFHLHKREYIDATMEQQLTTSMRVDLFYRTAECRLVPDGDGVQVVLTAGERKTAQFYAGFRFDNEEYAAVQLGADMPFKTSVPMDASLTVRLGKRIMARGEVTIHPRSFTRPSFNFSFYRNDINVYMKGERDYNILYNQWQSEFIPINFSLKNFTLEMGVRWDYLYYRNKLEADGSTDFTLKNEHFYSYHARVKYNSEDKWYFPSKGSRFEGEYAYLTDNFAKLKGDDGLSMIKVRWRNSFSIGDRFTIQPTVYGRLLWGPTVPLFYSNAIGGEWFGQYVEQQLPFAGVGYVEHVMDQFVAVQLQLQHRIGGSHYVLLRAAGAQQGEKMAELFDHKTLLGGQVAYFYNTMFGPIGASLGYSNRTKKVRLYLNIGFVF